VLLSLLSGEGLLSASNHYCALSLLHLSGTSLFHELLSLNSSTSNGGLSGDHSLAGDSLLSALHNLLPLCVLLSLLVSNLLPLLLVGLFLRLLILLSLGESDFLGFLGLLFELFSLFLGGFVVLRFGIGSCFPGI